jgi:hypothetical protein
MVKIRNALEVIQSKTFAKLTEVNNGRFRQPISTTTICETATTKIATTTFTDESSSTVSAEEPSAVVFVPHPHSKDSSVQSVRTAHSEGSTSQSSSFANSTTGKGWGTEQEEQGLLGENVPLIAMTTPHPQTHEEVADFVMTQRVLCDPFDSSGVGVAETSFTDDMYTKRNEGYQDSAQANTHHLLSTDSVENREVVLENVHTENRHLRGSGVTGNPRKSQRSEANVNQDVEGGDDDDDEVFVTQEELGETKDVLFPLRDKMSLQEIQRAVLRNQLSLKDMSSPEVEHLTCDL